MSIADELVTLRDVLRYGVSRFRAEKLVFGHGTTNALDEAAFLVLEALSLPIDELQPWLGARLTLAERQKLLMLIEARIETRKPAAYLLNKAYMHGVPFFVDERVIVPRSFIGELLFSDLVGGGGERPALIEDPDAVLRVLDLCTGSGCLAVLAASVFPNATIDAVDLSADALDVARINLADHGLETRIRLLRGDLFAPVEAARYDVILANPPYVRRAEVNSFPPEFAAEPPMAHLGGTDGLDLVRRILHDAPKHLNEGGGMFCEIGTGREAIETAFPDLPLLWLDTESSEGEVFFLSA